jgi:hypothetical protein
MGEHSDAVSREISGLSAARIDELRAEGVFE